MANNQGKQEEHDNENDNLSTSSYFQQTNVQHVWYDNKCIPIALNKYPSMYPYIFISRHSLKPSTQEWYDGFKERATRSTILGCIKHGIFKEQDFLPPKFATYQHKIKLMMDWFTIQFFDKLCLGNEWRNNEIKNVILNKWQNSQALKVSFKIQKKWSFGIGPIALFTFHKAEFVEPVPKDSRDDAGIKPNDDK